MWQPASVALRSCRRQRTPGAPGALVAAVAVNRSCRIGAEGRLRGLAARGADGVVAPSRCTLHALPRRCGARDLATLIGPGRASRIATVALQQLASAQLRFALD